MGTKSVAALAVLGTLTVVTRSTLMLATTAGFAGYLIAKRIKSENSKDGGKERSHVKDRTDKLLDHVKCDRYDVLTHVKDARRYVLGDSPFLIMISGFKVRALAALKVINPPSSLTSEVEAAVKPFRGEVSATIVLPLDAINIAYIIFATEKHVLHVTEKTIKRLTEKLAAALPAIFPGQDRMEVLIIRGEELAKILDEGFAS